MGERIPVRVMDEGIRELQQRFKRFGLAII